MSLRSRSSRLTLPTAIFAALLASASTGHAQMRGGGAPLGDAPQKGASVTMGGYNGPRDPAHRTIVGYVYKEDGKPATEAMVFLKDLKDSSIRSLAVDNKGAYHFGPLSLKDDFQLWAVEGDHQTTVKPISSYIETNYLSYALHLDQPVPPAARKPAATPAPAAAAH